MGRKRIFTQEQKQIMSFRVSERRRQIKEMATEYKGGKCTLCGYNKCARSMDFHHLDPTQKDFGISVSGNTISWENIKIELDKCILVCKNCHGEIHDGYDKIKINQKLLKINGFITDKTNKLLYKSPIRLSKKIEVECFNCKIKFSAFESRIKTHKNIFCSRKCKINNDQNSNWPPDEELLFMFSTLSIREIKVKLKKSKTTIYKKIRNIKQNLNILDAKKTRKKFTHKCKIEWPSDEELYKLVWEKPRSTLSKEFGVSDKTIAQRCQCKNIKMPERGYWQKLRTRTKNI